MATLPTLACTDSESMARHTEATTSLLGYQIVLCCNFDAHVK